jgi:hypothetical protein
MSGARLLCGLFGASLWCFAAGAAELPAGPNRDFVARTCGACHDLDMVFDAAGQTREGWDGAIEEMISYGLKVSPEERAMLLDYLANFMGPGSNAKPAATR